MAKVHSSRRRNNSFNQGARISGLILVAVAVVALFTATQPNHEQAQTSNNQGAQQLASPPSPAQSPGTRHTTIVEMRVRRPLTVHTIDGASYNLRPGALIVQVGGYTEQAVRRANHVSTNMIIVETSDASGRSTVLALSPQEVLSVVNKE